MSDTDTPAETSDVGASRTTLAELARLFLKIGVIGFGGPAAHVALMEDEVVVRRRWISRSHFLDLIGATNLIPGPNSTEMTMHVGFERAGWRGLITAGVSFILPAVIISGVLAWAYVRFGSLPEVGPFLIGIRPAVVAVVLGAVWRLGRTAVTGVRHALLGVGACAAVLTGLGEISALLVFGLIGTAWLALSQRDPGNGAARTLLLVLPTGAKWSIGGSVAGLVGAAATPITLTKIFLFFLKIGAVLYGSGYVLVAYLEGGLVNDYGWLSKDQLLDAIAIGQFTPGPVLSTATFIGYQLYGLPGAIVATAGIFLPSFLFVLILNPLIPKLRQSRWTAAFLDSVNVVSLALMAAVTIDLAATMHQVDDWIILAVASLLTFWYKANAAWIVLGCAGLGWFLGLVPP